MDLLAIRRRAMFIVLGASLFLAGVSLGLAVSPPFISHPAWARFSGVALGAMMAGNAALVLLPRGHRMRPWLWAGWIAALGYFALALIARSMHLA